MNMDLLCVERLGDCRVAGKDKAIFDDERVLPNILDLETLYMPSCYYFGTIQKDIDPYMRKLVAFWMLEVCEEQSCEAQVFPLAMNFMDRFLCVCPISRRQLQLLGCVCILLATKIRQCQPFPVDLLCAYTDRTVQPDQLRPLFQTWEILVLSKLKWVVTAVTGFDFVDHVLHRIPEFTTHPNTRQHAVTIVSLACLEAEYIQSRPSVVAAACICCAVGGLNPGFKSAVAPIVCALTRTDPAEVAPIVDHMDAMLTKERNSSKLNSFMFPGKQSSNSSLSATKLSSVADTDDARQPETPTDVQDVHF